MTEDVSALSGAPASAELMLRIDRHCRFLKGGIMRHWTRESIIEVLEAVWRQMFG